MVALSQLFSNDIATVSRQVMDSLVQITGQQGNLGAGTIWHQDGLILTNAHVIHTHAHQPVEVILPDGAVYPAQVVAVDKTQDLAALAIQAQNLPTINVGDSRKIRAGEWVIALGHPWGVLDSVTAGTVIGMGVDLPELRGEREWIALNLHLRPGHSGGPLVNVDGELVGINTMITGPDVGFAIPAHVVKDFLKSTIGLYPVTETQVLA